MSTTYAYTSQLTIIECANCHMDFGIPEGLFRTRRDDHRMFYCPLGHSNYYPGKSDAEKLRAELDASRRIAANERERRQRAEDRERNTEYRRRAAQGQVTKIKRRVGRGVCPCCNRTFVDLARHMAGQHPEFVETEATP